jgi:hypothetical protein
MVAQGKVYIPKRLESTPYVSFQAFVDQASLGSQVYFLSWHPQQQPPNSYSYVLCGHHLDFVVRGLIRVVAKRGLWKDKILKSNRHPEKIRGHIGSLSTWGLVSGGRM